MTTVTAQREKPTGIAVNRVGSDIEIVCLWFRWSAILQLFFYFVLSFFLATFLLNQSEGLRTGKMPPLFSNPTSLISLMVVEALLLLLFLRGTYASIAGIINKTTLFVGEQAIITRSGPLPFLVRDQTIPFNQIGRFYSDYKEVLQGKRDRVYRTRPFKLHSVYAATLNDKELELMGYLPQLKQAAFVVSLLRRLIS